MTIIGNASNSTYRIDSCEEYATTGVILENEAYGTMTQAENDEAYGFYYNACTSAGGPDNI